jgi:hypothetical protein
MGVGDRIGGGVQRLERLEVRAASNQRSLPLRGTYGRFACRGEFTKSLHFVVERKGIEPSTFALRTRRSPN